MTVMAIEFSVTKKDLIPRSDAQDQLQDTTLQRLQTILAGQGSVERV